MNKKILNISFILIFFTATAFPKHTDKTFISARPQLSNMPMEYTTWHTQIANKKKGKFAGSIQATGFYQKSNNKSDLGQYFGEYANNEDVIRDYISVYGNDGTSYIPALDQDGIDSGYILHTIDVNDLGGKISFRPSQESYGLRLDYYQLLKSFFIKINLPIVYVNNKIQATSIGNQSSFTSGVLDDPRDGKTLSDYLSGNLELISNSVTFADEQQKALTHAKIVGNNSTTRIADIDFSFGYNFLNRKGHRIAANIIATIPTGNEAKGEYLFEAISGNGNHWGLGAVFDSKFRLWKKDKKSIEFLFACNLKYLFENTQKRTPSLKDNDGNLIHFGHYYLGGKSGEEILFPLANVLTQDVKVKPDLHFEGLAGFALRCKNLTFDLGYNLFIKSSESISLKNEWADNTYAIANLEFATTSAFDPTDANDIATAILNGPIQKENLNLDSIKSPSAVTHKIYAGLGYAFNEWRYPLMLGLGGSYEFASNNSALEYYAIWGKVGVSF